MSWKVPVSKCYSCGAMLDMATEARKGAFPTPGAISICIYCLAISVFDGSLRLGRPSKWKAEQLAKDEYVQSRVKFIEEFKKENPPPEPE